MMPRIQLRAFEKSYDRTLNPIHRSTQGRICYSRGTPGTLNIDIPGTPAIGDFTRHPPIHIPGIPATSLTPHPCP
jgi:hypothetical protein